MLKFGSSAFLLGILFGPFYLKNYLVINITLCVENDLGKEFQLNAKNLKYLFVEESFDTG